MTTPTPRRAALAALRDELDARWAESDDEHLGNALHAAIDALEEKLLIVDTPPWQTLVETALLFVVALLFCGLAVFGLLILAEAPRVHALIGGGVLGLLMAAGLATLNLREMLP